MPGRGKGGKPKVRYPLGRVQHANITTVRTYGYRFRQTKRGRVPASQEDLMIYLRSRAQQQPAEETPAS